MILYAALGILIYYLQDYLFFQSLPVKRSHRYNFSIPYREVNLPYNENTNLNIIQFEVAESSERLADSSRRLADSSRRLADSSRRLADSSKQLADSRGVVLYFHGNRKNVGWYARFAPMFTEHGYEVWMIDYPGYGKSTGPLTEEILYNYTLQLYRLAAKKYKPENIIVFGKSMGTGLATYLASRVACRRVILETPYYSLSSVAAHFFPIYPMERMTRVKIPSWQYLQDVKEPVSVFHGTADGIVPYSNGARLKPFLKKEDEFITIEGGSHNDLRSFPLFRQKMDSLLGH